MKNGMRTRRTVITSLGTAAAVVVTGTGNAGAQTPAATRFQPARHPQDAWLDAVPGRHRTYIDAATVAGAGQALLYANNLFEANKSGYALAEKDIAIVIGLRHFATAFAFNDAIWAKYGGLMGTMLEFTNPQTKQAPTTNVYYSSTGFGEALQNFGNTIESVTKRGALFAVCDVATHFFAGAAAMATGANAEAVYNELKANLIPGSHMAAAGVVAVNRAQEHGYTLLTAL
jgi:hypothetical protein